MSVSVEHAPVDRRWLSQVQEAAFEPELGIIDAHHHLWERRGGYLVDDLLEDLDSGHRIEATVFVQCEHGYRPNGPAAHRSLGETEAVVSVAHEASRRGVAARICAGIVGFVDLRDSDVEHILEMHLLAGDGRFRGVRHIAAYQKGLTAGTLVPAEAGLLRDERFRKGLRCLQGKGLSFDAWVYHTQLDELAELVSTLEGLPVVLDHLGGPLGVGPFQGREREVFRTWRRSMAELSRRPNVFVKLGGLGMTISGATFHREPLPPTSMQLSQRWRPWIEACIELFGSNRCMFESNMPVDKGMCSYAILWNAFKRIVSASSAAEKAALFRTTAASFYRL